MIERLFALAETHAGFLAWLGGASAVVFVGSLLLLPGIIARLPADYFAKKERRGASLLPQTPALRLLVIALRNLVGGLALLAGIAMLVLPGQGLLTIVMALAVMHFPGKYRIERWFVSRPTVLSGLNWLRRRAGRPPLEL